MTLSKLINKAVEGIDKLEVKSFNLKTNKYQMEQILILDDKGRKMVKSFLTKCIQEAYEEGKKEAKQICIVAYCEECRQPRAISMNGLCPGCLNYGKIIFKSLTKQSKEDKTND